MPVWYHAGKIISTGESYKQTVKVTFFQGASLEDAAGLFNSSREGNVRRVIDWSEGAKVNAEAFKGLIKAATRLIDAKTKK